MTDESCKIVIIQFCPQDKKSILIFFSNNEWLNNLTHHTLMHTNLKDQGTLKISPYSHLRLYFLFLFVDVSALSNSSNTTYVQLTCEWQNIHILLVGTGEGALASCRLCFKPLAWVAVWEDGHLGVPYSHEQMDVVAFSAKLCQQCKSLSLLPICPPCSPASLKARPNISLWASSNQIITITIKSYSLLCVNLFIGKEWKV